MKTIKQAEKELAIVEQMLAVAVAVAETEYTTWADRDDYSEANDRTAHKMARGYSTRSILWDWAVIAEWTDIDERSVAERLAYVLDASSEAVQTARDAAALAKAIEALGLDEDRLIAAVDELQRD